MQPQLVRSYHRSRVEPRPLQPVNGLASDRETVNNLSPWFTVQRPPFLRGAASFRFGSEETNADQD